MDTGGRIEAMNKWKWSNDCAFIELRYVREEDDGAFRRKLANPIIRHALHCSQAFSEAVESIQSIQNASFSSFNLSLCVGHFPWSSYSGMSKE
jgi:hypothetical protein